jgi:hypothetical protein
MFGEKNRSGLPGDMPSLTPVTRKPGKVVTEE